MNNIPSAENLGIPVEADAEAVERKLVSFWKSAGEDGKPAVIRACSCNLIAFVRDRGRLQELFPVLAKVSEWHPSRSLAVFVAPDEELSPPDMHAWIGAQCSIPFSGGPQVCSETIALAARNRARLSLPDAVLSLLIPDLPVYLYWRSFWISDQDLVERLARFSHLLIVDSHRTREDPANRLRLLRLLIERPAGIAMRDLNWSRITPWRDLIAQFFDSASLNRYVHEITEVDITRNLSAPGSIPTRTLLLTGWLASSLGWQRVSAERSGDRWSSVWKSRGREIRVRFTGKESRAGQPPGIGSVTLRAGGEAVFSVFVEGGSRCLTATASAGESRLVHSVPEEPLDEASLLIRELSQTGEDAAFKAALAEAYELEKAFSCPQS